MSEEAAPLTCFGEGLDREARNVAGWPETAIVFAVEVMNPKIETTPDKTVIKLTGAVPIGLKRNGLPKFGKRADDLTAFVSLATYRAALGFAA